jgi:hypothetical protein
VDEAEFLMLAAGLGEFDAPHFANHLQDQCRPACPATAT